MTPELIGILSVGAALFVGLIGLGGMTLTLWRDVRTDVRDLRTDVRADIRGVRADLTARIDRLDDRVAPYIEGHANRAREEQAA